ncbi:MAG TPA: hypothetical protein VI958_01895, partial [Acidobacteriota bacterium]
MARCSDFQIERQKLKLSLEYENYVGIQRSEIATSGLKATYLLKVNREIAKRLLVTLDLQSGAKTNFDRQFQAGRLPGLLWSNRATTSIYVPFNRFFVAGSLYLRYKWLSPVPDQEEFIDIFGGEGFREITPGFSAGYTFSPEWEISGSLLKSDLNYADFPESNSNWTGVSFRVSRRFQDLKLNLDYRNRSIDFHRPIFTIIPVLLQPFDTGPNQHDQFWEAGANLEVFGALYFSGGYYYQSNDSNNPGFSFNSHRISILIGTELAQRYYLQAYGILQRQNFPGDDGFLQFPVLLDENDNNTMAASVVRK